MNTEPLASTELPTPAPQTKPMRLRSLEPLSPLQPGDIVVTSHRDGGLVCITAGVGRAAQVRVNLGFVRSTEEAAKIVKEGGDHARRALVGVIFADVHKTALDALCIAEKMPAMDEREQKNLGDLCALLVRLKNAGSDLVE